MTFSATEAAFEGFRLVRRNPLAILFWGAAYLVFFAIVFGVFGPTIAGLMATTEAMEGSQPSPADLEALGQTYFGFIGLLAPLGLVLSAILNTAVARAVVRPGEKSFGSMRLSSDELRVLGVSVVLAIVFAAATMVLAVVVGVAAGLAAQANAGLGVLAGVVLGVAAILALIWMSIRLSLAVPITVAERRLALFDSFAMTRGKTLPLLGMGVIAFIMSMLVSLLGSIIALPVTLSFGGLQQLARYEGASVAEILQAAGPAIAGWVVLNAIFSALQLAVLYAPFSAAYRDLKGLPDA